MRHTEGQHERRERKIAFFLEEEEKKKFRIPHRPYSRN